jgi:Tfp pilus assembly protein FimT
MSTAMETDSRKERSTIYVVITVLLVAAAVAAMIMFSSARETREAEEKADELSAAIEDAGATAPSRDQIVRVLGDDGGAVCENPSDSLSKAILLSQLANGAAGPGSRPVIADRKVVHGQLLIIEVYCPEELDDFQDVVADLDLDGEVAGE